MKWLVICLIAFASGTWAADSWPLSTDDTAAVVAVEQGRPVLKRLGVPGGRANWLPSGAPEILPPAVGWQGRSTPTNWRFQGGSLDSSGGKLTLRFTNADPPLELQSIWRARPGRGPVEHWLTIANKSGGPVTLAHQESLVLSGLAAPPGAADVWWINRGGGNAGTEGGTFTQRFDPKFDQVLTSDPTDGSSPVPWFAIQVAKVQGLYAGWEFSGIGRIHIRAHEVRVGNLPEFKTDLPAGETFLVPPSLVGCYSGDIDDGSYSLHRFVLEKLLPPLPREQPYPTLAYNLYLDGGGEKAQEADVLRSAATCKDLGFETFVPDAMWFPQAGDWRWDPARFPRSFGPIEQFVHQNGMKLGLWVAWTQGSTSDDPAGLDIRRHPDWFVRAFRPDEKMDYLHWNVLMDLGSDAAREWAERETQNLVSQFKLDYFKHDYSPIVTKCEQTNHRHRYGVDVSYWSTMGYYQVHEKLSQRFPELTLEGCSGGGHIKDFGYIRRVHYIVTTDTLSSLPDRQSMYDSTFALPPAVLQAYTYENHYNHDADRPRPYLWRSAMMGAWQIDPTKSADWTPEEQAEVKKATAIYKSWIRPMLRDVKVHHILPRPDGYHWDGMFYWSPGLKHGTLYIFRPNNDQVEQRVRLKGLEPARRYRVRSQDGSVAEETRTGTGLMQDGLRIRLPGKYTSDLVYLEEGR
jgi:hypothetical protein